MKLTERLKTPNKSIMVLGTSSGVGKSIITVAICRVLKNIGEKPIPFKGQNMSNNAWVDSKGGEMAHSQVLQAIASGVIPKSEMNPILLKPQGNSTSEVIHLGKSVGITSAKQYYQDWFESGWETIKHGIKMLISKNKKCRLVIEGAGSPVEMNLIHRDLTNLRIAKYLNSNCVLVADIEKGGVFAQIIGTLELMKPDEKDLIKGIIINRFRGDISLFDEGKKWLEQKTNIPILGIMPSLNQQFPPEDSLDLSERKMFIKNNEIKIGIIMLPSISNFSDFDPLENEENIEIVWIKDFCPLDDYDLIILPGSKQTIKDQIFLEKSGLKKNILSFYSKGGIIFGICGGLQMLGEYLEDPFFKEGRLENQPKIIKGLGLLPLKTIFAKTKKTQQIKCESLWPSSSTINGFEIHNGVSELMRNNNKCSVKAIFKDYDLGWYIDKEFLGIVAGTYIHGVFENDDWRKSFLDLIREKKGISKLDKKLITYKMKRERNIQNLAHEFQKHININPLLD